MQAGRHADGHNKANRRFPKLCERAVKLGARTAEKPNAIITHYCHGSSHHHWQENGVTLSCNLNRACSVIDEANKRTWVLLLILEANS
jgi:hypothetical protein